MADQITVKDTAGVERTIALEDLFHALHDQVIATLPAHMTEMEWERTSPTSKKNFAVRVRHA